jgi:hypothetical protein
MFGNLLPNSKFPRKTPPGGLETKAKELKKSGAEVYAKA